MQHKNHTNAYHYFLNNIITILFEFIYI